MSACCRQNAMGEDCRCMAGVEMTREDTIPQFAADRIEALEAEIARLRTEVLAREAAAYQRAVREAADLCVVAAAQISSQQALAFRSGDDSRGYQLHVAQCAVLDRLGDILALATDPQQSALDDRLAEERSRAMAEMETLVRKHIYHDIAGTGFEEDAFDDALAAYRARGEGE